MTAGRRDRAGTPFGAWLREHPELDARTNDLSVTDSDMWVHKYKLRDETGRPHAVDHVMLIEVKCFAHDVPFAQADTLSVIDLILRKATVRNMRRYPIKVPDRRIGRPGILRTVRWLGLHVMQLSNDRPDNSDVMVWDGHYQIKECDLIELLKFERDPDYPQKTLNTRRHHRRPFRECQPSLAIVP